MGRGDLRQGSDLCRPFDLPPALFGLLLSRMTFRPSAPLPRRTFLAQSLAAASVGWAGFETLAESTAVAASEVPPVNAMSRLKKRLSEGRSATLLLISDSTGYKDVSGTRRWLRWLASQFPKYRVTELYWAEWVVRAPTGPRNYGEPVVIAPGEGQSPPTLTVLNAVLPGAFAQAMVDGSRWTNMRAPLRGQPPDLILWNHGHNHQANIGPSGFAYGRGTLLAPLGRVGMEFPQTPQAAIVQNPWRDSDGYERVRDWWLATAQAMPGLTLIDGYAPFVAEKKNAGLYQDNVHPNAQGYELIYKQLVAAWQNTTPQEDVTTTCWAMQPAEPLMTNGDLATWTVDLPVNWRIIHNAKAQKDTAHTYDGAPYSLALTGTTINDGLQLSLPKAAVMRARGKTISFAVLCYVPHEAEQDIQVKFTTSSSDQVTGSIQNARDNWKWIVMAGCPVPAEASLAYVSIMRSFAKVPNETPFYIQKAVIVEGDVPKGGM